MARWPAGDRPYVVKNLPLTGSLPGDFEKGIPMPQPHTKASERVVNSRAFAGHIVTNPSDGRLADPFVRKALTLADDKVAFLMQSGFLFGSKRAGNKETWIEWASQHVAVQPWH